MQILASEESIKGHIIRTKEVRKSRNEPTLLIIVKDIDSFNTFSYLLRTNVHGKRFYGRSIITVLIKCLELDSYRVTKCIGKIRV